MPIGWNVAKLDRKKFIESVDSQLDACATLWLESMDRASVDVLVNSTMQMVEPCEKAFLACSQTYWWTDEIAELRTALILRRRATRAQNRLDALAWIANHKAVKVHRRARSF